MGGNVARYSRARTNGLIRRGLAIIAVLLGVAPCHGVEGADRAQDAADAVTGVHATVLQIGTEYANIHTDLPQAALTRMGVTTGTRFRVAFQDQSVTAVLGTAYTDVPNGEWVGLIDPEGTLQIAVSFGSAATELGCKTGDRLLIQPVASPDAESAIPKAP